jgi:uncharacterized Zn-binding protein involved in type VI secretion
MSGIARQGDIVGPGGILTGPLSSDTNCNGRPVVLHRVAYTAHDCCGDSGCDIHCSGAVSGAKSASATVFVNGVPFVLLGDSADCGHSVVTASQDSFIGV